MPLSQDAKWTAFCCFYTKLCDGNYGLTFQSKGKVTAVECRVRWKLLGSNFSGIGSCILYLSAELSTSCLYPKGWRVTFAFPGRARHLSYRVHTDDRKHFLEGKTCAVRLKWTTPKAREERFQSGSETLQNQLNGAQCNCNLIWWCPAYAITFYCWLTRKNIKWSWSINYALWHSINVKSLFYQQKDGNGRTIWMKERNWNFNKYLVALCFARRRKQQITNICSINLAHRSEATASDWLMGRAYGEHNDI